MTKRKFSEEKIFWDCNQYSNVGSETIFLSATINDD